MTVRDIGIGTAVATTLGAVGEVLWGGKEGSKVGALMMFGAGVLMTSATVQLLGSYDEENDMSRAAYKAAKTFDIHGLSA